MRGYSAVRLAPDIAALIRASVTGLDESIPFRVIHSPDTCFCTGSAQGRRLMGCVEDRSANLRMRGRVPHPGWRPDLIHRPGEGTSLRGRPGAVARPKTVDLSVFMRPQPWSWPWPLR